MMRYYSILRPVGLGTYPREGAEQIRNYDCRQYVQEIGREAWGYIDYSRELTAQEMAAYELTATKGKEAIDKKQLIKMMIDAGMIKAEIKSILKAITDGEFTAADLVEQLTEGGGADGR